MDLSCGNVPAVVPSSAVMNIYPLMRTANQGYASTLEPGRKDYLIIPICVTHGPEMYALLFMNKEG